MNGKRVVLLALLASLTACTPVIYEASYYDRTLPTRYSYGTTSAAYYPPIEITVVTDRFYSGSNFRPVHLTITNDQYIEVPAKTRGGRLQSIFAHYLNGELHFDSDRHCSNIPGTSRFTQAPGWARGHRYDRINAGHDYDLTGLQLVVRTAKKSDAIGRNLQERPQRDRARLDRPGPDVRHEGRRPDQAARHMAKEAAKRSRPSQSKGFEQKKERPADRPAHAAAKRSPASRQLAHATSKSHDKTATSSKPKQVSTRHFGRHGDNAKTVAIKKGSGTGQADQGEDEKVVRQKSAKQGGDRSQRNGQNKHKTDQSNHGRSNEHKERVDASTIETGSAVMLAENREEATKSRREHGHPHRRE